MELALTGVADDDGAVAKGAAQEVRLVAQHTAAAKAVSVVHDLWGPSHKHTQQASAPMSAHRRTT
jgi:hypothetical protein